MNTIPRPWLIRLSYAARPVLIWFFKGENFTDPIDGGLIIIFCLTDMKNREKMRFRPELYHWKGTDCFGFT